MPHTTHPIATRPLHRLVACLLALWCAAVAPTQTPPAGANTVAARIAAVDRQMVAVLLEFARTAEANKLPSRALRAYQEVVDCYDATNATALLLATRMRFFGAASQNFEYWVVDDRSAPAQCAAWAERGLLLAEFLVGTGTGAKVLDASRQRWAGYVRNDLQRDRLLATAPAVLGKYTVEQVRLFGGQHFTAARGLAVVSWHAAEIDADRAVSHVVKYCLLDRSNPGLGEGVVHLASWLLCGTMITSFMDLARTSSGQEVHLPEVGDAWLKLLQDEIAAGRDVPLVQVPREPIANFRPGVRLKSWGFMLWLVCRYPDTWFELVEKLSTATTPTPEQVASAFEAVLGRGVDEVEAEWRAWAQRGSRLGRASGFSR